jgi:hypothetical protein
MNAYLEALRALLRRKAAPSTFNSADWQAVGPAIRQRSFFSATINSAKVLNRMRNMLLDWKADAGCAEEGADPRPRRRPPPGDRGRAGPSAPSMTPNPHRGSDFNDFLAEEGLTPTPRTDAAIAASDGQWSFPLRDLAQDMERELAVWKHEVDTLRKQLEAEHETAISLFIELHELKQRRM